MTGQELPSSCKEVPKMQTFWTYIRTFQAWKKQTYLKYQVHSIWRYLPKQNMVKKLVFSLIRRYLAQWFRLSDFVEKTDICH
jgi:hypothetical protein